jgi:hypothetical protein
MDQFLNRPEFQSAVIPFFVGLSFYLGLRKLTAYAWGWAVFAAFLISAGLINGLTFTPLTGTRKIILLILASFIIIALVRQLITSSNLQRMLLPLPGVAALIWVFWKLLIRMDVLGIAAFLAGGVGLLLWLLWTFDRIGNEDVRLHGAGFTLLLGTGLAATAGASALLGQLALGLSTASGGVFLAWVLVGKANGSGHNSGLTSGFIYALAAALLGLAAVMFARVPWYALIPLAVIPFATGMVPKITDSRFINALVTSLPGLIIALATAFWVWRLGGASSGY